MEHIEEDGFETEADGHGTSNATSTDWYLEWYFAANDEEREVRNHQSRIE